MENRSFGWVLVLLVLGVLAQACLEEKSVREAPPPGLIPQKPLRAFLYDLHEVEAALIQSGIRQDSASALFTQLEAELYKKHGLDSGRVGRSLRYYCRNLDMLDSLYHSMEGMPTDSVKK
jgi:Domain of unknown function (DUF4296)